MLSAPMRAAASTLAGMIRGNDATTIASGLNRPTSLASTKGTPSSASGLLPGRRARASFRNRLTGRGGTTMAASRWSLARRAMAICDSGLPLANPTTVSAAMASIRSFPPTWRPGIRANDRVAPCKVNPVLDRGGRQKTLREAPAPRMNWLLDRVAGNGAARDCSCSIVRLSTSSPIFPAWAPG